MKIKIESLSFKYKDKTIMSDINYEFTSGINFINGLNGVGKTTLLDIIYKQQTDYAGKVHIDNCGLNEIDLLEFRTEWCAYISQQDKLIEDLTLSENIEVLTNDYDQELLLFYREHFKFEKIVNKKVSKLSGGERQKLKILIALLKDTPILLIDEFENNLDTVTIAFMYERLQELDKIILIVTHNSYNVLQEIWNLHEFNYIDMVNNNLQQVIDTRQINKNVIKKDSCERKQKKSFRSLNKKMISTCLVVGLIITIGYIIMLPYYEMLVHDINSLRLVNSEDDIYDDDVLTVFTPIQNPNIYRYGDISWLEQEPYYFSEKDYNYLKNSSYVKSVYPLLYDAQGYTSGSPNDVGNYEVTDSIDLSLANYKKYNVVADGNTDSETKIYWTMPQAPKNIMEKLHFHVNPLNVKSVIYGRTPADETNQIMIDQYLATYFATQLELNSLEELIGKEVTFTSHDEYPADYTGEKTNEHYKNNFIVSGIYQSANPSRVTVYPAYNDESYIINIQRPWRYEPETKQERVLDEYEFTYEMLGYPTPKIDLMASGKYQYPGFYIELDDSTDMEEVTNLIEEHNPYIYIKSNYMNQTENYFRFKKSTIYINLIREIIYISAYIISLIIFIKYYFTRLSTISNILRFYGISSTKYVKTTERRLLIVIALFLAVLVFAGKYFLLNFAFDLAISIIVFIIYYLFRRKGVVSYE